jgi:hypothetical protein
MLRPIGDGSPIMLIRLLRPADLPLSRGAGRHCAEA